MATPSQIAANRRNAAGSTGPRTKEGRAVASRNSLKHGLTAAQVVLIFGETEDDFARFHEGMREAFSPADAIEEQLVERVVLCAWRLRRAYRAEAGTMNDELREAQNYWRRHGTGEKRNWHSGIAFSRAAWKFETISRYEATLERSLHRALLTLERRQARRQGEPVSAPIAVQVDTLDDGAPAEPVALEHLSSAESA